jgi:hypothetical protein
MSAKSDMERRILEEAKRLLPPDGVLQDGYIAYDHITISDNEVDKALFYSGRFAVELHFVSSSAGHTNLHHTDSMGGEGQYTSKIDIILQR